MRSIKWAAVSLALTLALGAGAAQAQSAVRGPLRYVGATSNPWVLHYIAGPRPMRTPAAPVEVWSWTFYGTVNNTGDYAHDSRATFSVIDCAARTVRNHSTELYLDGGYRRAVNLSGDAAPVQAGTVLDALVQSACIPGHDAGRPEFADVEAVRAEVAGFFASR